MIDQVEYDAVILGIETSCDDTSAAVIKNQVMLSNVIATQSIHNQHGGVVPELASRQHTLNIIPVVHEAIKKAGIKPDEIDAIAFTRGPGLIGSLVVGVNFATGLSVALDAPLIEVNHLQGHIFSHFLQLPDRELPQPQFPFLCLLVSGGHTQLVIVRVDFEFEIIGSTIDDAAGEAFDKCAKTLGLPYPGGPEVDRLAKLGNPNAFTFAKPRVGGYDYSFSGLKTSFLYTVRDHVAENPNFIKENLEDLCASLQKTIIDILMFKLEKAARDLDIDDIGIAGGVSANSGLRDMITKRGRELGWNTFLPERIFTTDNGAMIAIAGHFRYWKGRFTSLDVAPISRAQALIDSE